MERDADLICVVEFNGNERTVTAIVSLGELSRFSLPGTITWPDGSQSDSVEILISQKTPDEIDCPPSAAVDGVPQSLVNRPRG
jgi:hypothetical protein